MVMDRRVRVESWITRLIPRAPCCDVTLSMVTWRAVRGSQSNNIKQLLWWHATTARSRSTRAIFTIVMLRMLIGIDIESDVESELDRWLTAIAKLPLGAGLNWERGYEWHDLYDTVHRTDCFRPDRRVATMICGAVQRQQQTDWNRQRTDRQSRCVW